MRGKVPGWLFRIFPWGLAAVLDLIAVVLPTGAFAADPSQKQIDPDRCQFLMDKVSSILLGLNPKGDITFFKSLRQRFLGYSGEEILGKPMLGTLTPAAGFEGRDLKSFLTELVRDPNRYAYSVNVNMLRNGERVWIFWANKGIYDDQGRVQEVLRVGLDITARELRLEAATQELRDIGQMLEGRDWV